MPNSELLSHSTQITTVSNQTPQTPPMKDPSSPSNTFSQPPVTPISSEPGSTTSIPSESPHNNVTQWLSEPISHASPNDNLQPIGSDNDDPPTFIEEVEESLADSSTLICPRHICVPNPRIFGKQLVNASIVPISSLHSILGRRILQLDHDDQVLHSLDFSLPYAFEYLGHQVLENSHDNLIHDETERIHPLSFAAKASSLDSPSIKDMQCMSAQEMEQWYDAIDVKLRIFMTRKLWLRSLSGKQIILIDAKSWHFASFIGAIKIWSALMYQHLLYVDALTNFKSTV
jgi:hypothetical protein